jgi:hypothetical protein
MITSGPAIKKAKGIIEREIAMRMANTRPWTEGIILDWKIA